MLEKKKKYLILVVDDEEDNLELLERTLRRNYRIQKARNGEEGLRVLEKENIDMIITDQRMPHMTGVEMLNKTFEKYPDVIRIILTGYTDVDDLIDAINQGHVYRYITKPWEPRELRITVKRALESYQLRLENKKLMDDLINSEKLAVVGQVAGSIAHEIKNQLVGIMFAELIKEKYPNDPELQSYVQYILDSYNHILAMVDEIRDFGKRKKEDYTATLTSIADIMENVLTLCRLDSNLNKAKYITNFPCDISTFLNKDRIKQVLLNIIKNGIEASADNEGKIIIDLEKQDDEAILSITDNGHGISEENLARIWEPFYTTKGENGTGLGLDICRKIIEHHNGKINVESRINVGTTFRIHLPIVTTNSAS